MPSYTYPKPNRLQFSSFIVVLFMAFSAFALPPNFETEDVVRGGLDSGAVYLVQLPDGRMLAGEKTGKIRIFDPSDPIPVTTGVYMTITDIETGGERGLTSIAVDPDFSQNPYIYVFYTHASSSRNRIARFTHLGNTGDLGSETLIWQDNEDWSDCCHYGGGLGFGPDDRLYLTTGEEFDGNQAQDLTRAGGKVIRINRDGSIPLDNPFYDGPGGNLDEIWALGLRNPYRAHWDLPTGRFYIGEVGGNNNSIAREDIHIASAGANFGWPLCEGQCVDPQYSDPIFDYGHLPSIGGAVTLGTIYRGSMFPSEYVGDLFYADYVRDEIRFLNLDAAGSVTSDEDFGTFNVSGAIVHVMEGQDGALYLVDYLGTITRIIYTATNQAPTINSTTVNTEPGPQPAIVSFDVDAEDPEQQPLDYHWFFGDGSDAMGKSVNHTYLSNGPFNAYVEVSDGERTTTSSLIVVQVGNIPQVTISQPLPNALFRAGDQVSFAASAVDPDETLGPANFSWDVVLTHNTHTHPAVTDQIGDTGSFSINTSGHEYLGNTGYDLTVTATDSDGLTGQETVHIVPEKVDVTFQTSPISTSVFIDGVAVADQTTYDTLIDFEHVVSVPNEVCLLGTLYAFDSWSDGGALTHVYTVPVTNDSLTANFVASGSCSSIPTSGLVLHLEADTGVSTGANGVVTNWDDQSVRANDLSPSGDPTLVPGALNGLPVIEFDGDGDKLERVSNLMGFPAGNNDRTVVLLARYDSVGYGGFGYGNNSCGQAFGAVVDSNGFLTVQGWCIDEKSTTSGTGQGWLAQSITLEGGVVNHYKDNVLIDSANKTYNTLVNTLVLGAEIDSAPYMDMDVAAVLVYDRALNSTELEDVQAYFQDKYFSGTGNQPPVAVGDVDSVDDSQSTTTDVLANDSDVDGNIDPMSVVVTTLPNNGSVQVNQTTGAITYFHSGGGTSDSYQYRVLDNEGAQSNSATVTISIGTVAGNQPPNVVPDVVSLMPGQAVLTNVLANDSDDVAIDTTTVVITQPPSKGTVLVDAVSGIITYTHSGGSAGADSYQYTVSDNEGLVSASANVAVTIGGGQRVGNGLLALYTFDEGAGTTVGDTSNVGTPLDLTIDSASSVSWGVSSLTLNQATTISSVVAADKISDAVEASNEITVEALVAPSNVSQSGPARIVSVSTSTGARNATLGQQGDAYNMRLRTTATNANGSNINLSSLPGSADTTIKHVVYTRASDGTANIYIDGVLSNSTSVSGSTDNWSSNYPLLLGNEFGGNRPWLGSMDLVAVYDRALTASEVVQNQAAGSGTLNQAPVAVDDASNVIEAGSVDVDVIANDTDQDGSINSSTVIVLNSPAHGNVSVDPASGVITYVHDGSQNFSDSFQYHVADNLGLVSNTATVDIVVADLPGSAPVAVDDFGTGQPGSSFDIDVLANDSDADGPLDTTSVQIEIQPDNGSLLVDGLTGTVSYTHDGGPTTADSFRYAVMDLDGRISNSATVNIAIGVGSVPQAGLVMRLESDNGVVVGGGGNIDGWNDLSGSGNHLVGVGNPTLFSGVLNGLPALDFDGTGDGLERIGAITGLPSGNNDRTIVFLANYQGTGFGGFSYGTNACLQNFGTVIAPNGNLALQGWCTDYVTTENALGAGWLVQSVVVEGGVAKHYKGSTQIATNDVSSFNTAMSQIRIGTEIDGSPSVNMQVGAVFVYDRALTEIEFTEVQGYIQEKFFGSTANQAPTAVDDADDVALSGSIVTTVLANDSDPEGLIDVTSVEIIAPPLNGTAVANSVTGEIEYTNTSAAASDSYQYRFSDALGAQSNIATVAINIAPNQAPDAVDDFAFVVSGQSVDIDVAANDTDVDGTVNPATVVIAQQPVNGTVSVNPTTGVVTYSQTIGAAVDDSFTYRVDDNNGNTSNEGTIAVRIGSTPLPLAGLVLQLESESGVLETTAGFVTAWSDLSGEGNHLSAGVGEPAYIPAALNGLPVVDFDGLDDVLERVGSLNNLPTGNTDRSVFIVANYRANSGYGGFAYGTNSCTQTFGTVIEPGGNLTVQGWCTDFDSGTAGTGQGWLVQSAVLTAGQLEHFMGSALIGTHDASALNTVLTRMSLGAGVTGSPVMNMQVAAVLVYNATLSPVEVAEVQTYLQEKYLASNANVAPSAVDDADAVVFQQSVTTDILLNDTDPDNLLDPTSVTIVTQPTKGTLSVNGTNGQVTYSHNGAAGSVDTYQYRVSDVLGLASNIATVTISVSGAPNDPPVANDDTATAVTSGSITIDVLSNDTDSDGSLDPTTVVITSIPLNGTYSVDALSGVVTYNHNGTATTTDALQYTVMDDSQAVSNAATVSIEIVEQTVPAAGLVLHLEADQGVGLGSGNSVVSWADQSGSQYDLTAIGSPTLQTGVLNGQSVVGFDGVDDRMELLGSLTNLPGGNGDRTVIMLANYEGTGFGGFAYGSNACRQAFGAVVSPAGNLSLQGWCTDFESATQGTGAGYLVHSVIVAAGQAQQYLGSNVIGTHNVANFNTARTRITLGAEIDGVPFVEMQVAAVLVYDRALDPAEFASIQEYLQNKYLTVGGNQPPIAVDDFDSVDFSGVTVTDVLANDSDPEGQLDESATTIVTQPTSGTVSVNAQTGVITYTHDGVSVATTDSYEYRVFDLAGAGSNTATVSLDITGLGNQLPVANDDAVMVMVGGTIDIDVLDNDADPDGLIDPTTVFLTQFPTNGTHVLDDTTGVVSYTHDGGPSVSDVFQYEVMDDDQATSNIATVNISIANSVLPQAGLVLQFEADQGVVTTTGNSISGWNDLSGSNNHLVSVGSPTLVPSALNGRPVVDFDGTADRLERNGGLIGLPTGNSDRTVIVLANYQGTGLGGFAYGNNACRQTFGTVVDGSGNLTVQGWCTDFASGTTGTGVGWVIQSAVVSSGQVDHYLGDSVIDTNSVANFNTSLNRIVVGAEIDGAPFVDMQVAAILVYDRALVGVDFDNAQSYLQEKYFGIGGNQAPVAVDDTDVVLTGGATTTDVLANDTDDSSLAADSVVVVNGPSNGTTSVNILTGEIIYQHTGTEPTTDSYQYRVSDNQGLASNLASVTISVENVNQPPVALDDSDTVLIGDFVTTAVLQNDTDADGTIDSSTVNIVTSPAHGSVVVLGNGEITYTHDGSSNTVDSYTYEVMDDDAEVSNVATVSVTALLPRVTNGLQALYLFDEGVGTTVADSSGVGVPIDLTILDPSKVSWSVGALSVNESTLISSLSAASKLNTAISTTEEITVEGWITPSNLTQTGPARMVSLSQSTNMRNFTLGQGASGGAPDQFDLRLRTTSTGSNGANPSLASSAGTAALELTHVVYTRDAVGNANFYVNNVLVSSGLINGGLSNWNSSHQLLLANEATGTRPWLGTFDLVAIYDRALSSTEVDQNYGAGPQ